MGCGASGLRVGKERFGVALERQYSSAVTSLRDAPDTTPEEEPLPMGDIRILQQADNGHIRTHYVMGRIIGKGQFGTCRLVTDRRSGERLACKSISKRRLTSAGDVADVRRELAIMYHLAGHPNIVTIRDAHEDRGYVHLVEELCSGGELFDSIVERGCYSERDAAATFRCIAAVVAHCHNMGVMHRDIKPENFLLSSTLPGATIKATDFGLSCFFSEGQTFTDVVGSAFYVAPEVLRKRYDKRADIWSLGVLLYILLCGRPPFYAETERDIFQSILHGEVSFDSEPWPSISEGAKHVIRRMLERNVAVRATASEVLQHEWVRENGSAAARALDNEVLRRLQNFAALNKLQQEALKVIATHLPESEIEGLRAMFTEMDADGSGSITVEELTQALQRKGTQIPPEELQRIMAQADISGDGTLDYEEFLAATMSLSKLEHEEHLFMAFKFFDTDGSGYITRDELAAALSKVCSELDIDRMMAQADRSGDGRIDYAEFCDLMRSGKPALVAATRTVKKGIMKSARAGRLWGEPKQPKHQVRMDTTAPRDYDPSAASGNTTGTGDAVGAADASGSGLDAADGRPPSPAALPPDRPQSPPGPEPWPHPRQPSLLPPIKRSTVTGMNGPRSRAPSTPGDPCGSGSASGAWAGAAGDAATAGLMGRISSVLLLAQPRRLTNASCGSPATGGSSQPGRRTSNKGAGRREA